MEENAKEIEHELRENIDLLQNQLREKERQMEQLQYTIGDHERTILKFRETVKNMQVPTISLLSRKSPQSKSLFLVSERSIEKRIREIRRTIETCWFSSIQRIQSENCRSEVLQ